MTVERSMSTHPVSRRPRAVRGRFTPLASLALVRIFAAVLALHGVAHFAGTGDSFGNARDGGSVEYLAGAWTVSDPSLLRLLGVLWALAGVAFLVAAVLTWTRSARWPCAVVGVAAASLVVVTVALPASLAGVLIDVALLAVAWRAGGFRRERGQR